MCRLLLRKLETKCLCLSTLSTNNTLNGCQSLVEMGVCIYFFIYLYIGTRIDLYIESSLLSIYTSTDYVQLRLSVRLLVPVRVLLAKPTLFAVSWTLL